MLLELENALTLHLIESPDDLALQVASAMDTLEKHETSRIEKTADPDYLCGIGES